MRSDWRRTRSGRLRARRDPPRSRRRIPLRERSRSVSSKRRMNVPPRRRANSQLSRAVRALPIWMRPVGEGAKRTTGRGAIRLHRSVARPPQYGVTRPCDSGSLSPMTIGALAAGICATSAGIHGLSAALAAPRCRRRSGRPMPPPKDAPALQSSSRCAASRRFRARRCARSSRSTIPATRSSSASPSGDDPIAPLVRGAIAANPQSAGAPADRRRPDQRQSQTQQCRQGMEGGALRVGDHRRFQCADADRLHSALAGALALRHRHRLRAADRLATRSRSPPRSNAPFSTPIRRAGNMPANACGYGFAQGKTMLWRREMIGGGRRHRGVRRRDRRGRRRDQAHPTRKGSAPISSTGRSSSRSAGAVCATSGRGSCAGRG